MAESVELVPSLIRALVRLDGRDIVLRSGDRAHITTAEGRIELGTRTLPDAAMAQLIHELLSPEALLELRTSGRVQSELRHPDTGPGRFVVIATGRNQTQLVIRRLEVEEHQDRPVTRPPRLLPHVLLIDDSLDQLDLYEWALSGRYEVCGTSDGMAGVTIAATQQPDVVIVDLSMPIMDGWEVCWHLKKNPVTAAIPIIIMTAHDGTDIKQKAMEAGAADLLHKPCNADQLRDRVSAVLQHQFH